MDAVIEEVTKLKEASAITKVLYPSWLSNTIVVKMTGKWRVCVDFTSLNWACQKYCVEFTFSMALAHYSDLF